MTAPECYVLPTIDFVGGETQDLMFHVWYYRGRRPYSLTSCSADFSIVSATNRTGAPIVIKRMEVRPGREQTVDNVLAVTLGPQDTVDLDGKYIYQIQIRDIDGDVEIPKLGAMYIANNINKGFIR